MGDSHRLPAPPHALKPRHSRRFDPERAQAEVEWRQEESPMVKKQALSVHDMKVFVQQNLLRLIQTIKQWMAQ